LIGTMPSLDYLTPYAILTNLDGRSNGTPNGWKNREENMMLRLPDPPADDEGGDTVTFLCEDCGQEFEAYGTLVPTDNDGGVDFIPFNNADDGSLYCPNDPMTDMGETQLPHDISVVT